jgi:hypothetical protein
MAMLLLMIAAIGIHDFYHFNKTVNNYQPKSKKKKHEKKRIN